MFKSISPYPGRACDSLILTLNLIYVTSEPSVDRGTDTIGANVIQYVDASQKWLAESSVVIKSFTLSSFKMKEEDALKLIKLASTMTTGIMAGSATYINLVEHPARMQIDDVKSLHKQWKEGFDRAKILMIGVSLIPICGGIAAYAMNQSKGKPWLITGGMLLFNVPYTILVMMPRSIHPINDYDVVARKDPAVVKETVDKWNTFHKVRTVVDLAAFAWCVYNLVFD